MPIKLPNLDDRTFADLVAEAHTLIPVHAPKWTNHNESDPGITLVELFAYLTEMQIYRLNRVTDSNVCAFLKLIDGVERKPSKRNRGMVTRSSETTEVALRDEVRDAVLKLRQQDRAVSCEDFERLARETDHKVSRACCIPQRNLATATSNQLPSAYINVVIVPTEALFETILWSEKADAYQDVTASEKISLWSRTGEKSQYLYLGSSSAFDFFTLNLAEPGTGYTLTIEYFDGKDWTAVTAKKDRLVDGTANWKTGGVVTFTRPANWKPTERNRVNRYWLRISSTSVPTKIAVANRIFRDLVGEVKQYLEPRRLLTTRVRVAGPRIVTISVHVNLFLKPDAPPKSVEKEAENRLRQFLNLEVWPFGRNVYVSEIYRLLDRIPGVDFVTKLATDIVTIDDGSDDRLIKQDGELVAIRLNPDELANLGKIEIVFPKVAHKKKP